MTLSESVVDLHPRNQETLEEEEVRSKAVGRGTIGTVEEALMHLRKRYKRSESQIMRTDSHLYFVQQCIAQNTTPKGLQVGIKCQAMMMDKTNVQEKFKDINTVAEEDYKESLKGHYQILKQGLTAEHEELLTLEEALLSKATPEVAENHRRLREVTDQNLLREKQKMDESKKRKVEALKNPPPSNLSGTD